MFQAFRPATRAVAAAALLSSFAVALPVMAQTSPPPGAVPGAPAASASTAAAPAPAAKAAKHSQRVEAHIADLKKKLMITDAQDPQWESFASVMRDNGEAMEAALQERDASKGISAEQDLQSYAKIAQTHADGAQKLAAAFQPLYDSLSPAQKKNADAMFEQTRRGDGGKANAKSKKM
jgi:hypothetical protein